MSEPRKNILTIDGAQSKEEEHVASYKPIPDSEQEFRTSKSSIGKSKEKVSDPAEEKLLNKEDEAKIVTRVDMPAEAKYVVGDHRNGDAKIELDANKRQFSGLTKEELMKYADDPFWVRLRWFMFILFWALWLAMLAGAIAIIIQAPKCAPPPAKSWYEIGPLADYSSESAADYTALEKDLALLEEAKVQAIFINPCEETYDVLDSDTCIDGFKEFLVKAKEKSVKVIVDLTANFVSTTHEWFKKSENGSAEFADYFVWAGSKDYDDTKPKVPTNWISRYDEPAWSWSEARRAFYLHQYRVQQADLNFHRAPVVKQFDLVLNKWMEAGAAGVRLMKVRQLLVNESLKDERPEEKARGATLNQYLFLKHSETSDQPQLDSLLAHWSHLVTKFGEDTVFTIHEDGALRPEWYRLRNSSLLRPPSAAPLSLAGNLTARAQDLNKTYSYNWAAIQLKADDPEGSVELASFAMLLPVTPVLTADQLPAHDNDTLPSESFAHLSTLRLDGSIQHGHRYIGVVGSNSSQQMLAAARWKSGHTGYVALFNPEPSAASANLTSLSSLPATLTIHHVSSGVRQATNYTSNMAVQANSVYVPGYSTVVLSYVPDTSAEQ